MKRAIALVILLAAAGCTTSGTAVDKSKMSEGYYMKGLSFLEQKNFEMALVEFERSIQTDSNNKMAYYAIGHVNDLQSKWKEAEKYYKKAISIDSDFSEAYNALGVVYFKQREWKKAVKSFERALKNKLYTTPHLPYLNMGDLYMAKKEYDNAINAYRESKRYANLEFTVFKLGTALYEAGRIKEAIDEFKEGVEISPKNANMRYGLALALLKNGKKREAVAEFRKAAELAPGTDVARNAADYIKTLR